MSEKKQGFGAVVSEDAAVFVDMAGVLEYLGVDSFDAARRIIQSSTTVLGLEIQRLRIYLSNLKSDPDRCEKFPKGEQCALKAGHEGHCKWANGD